MLERSLSQFFNVTQGPEHGEGKKLFWPGSPDGFPFRGETAPIFKNHETLNLPHAMVFNSRMFQLWVPEEKTDFDRVMNWISNSLCGLLKRTDQWIPEQRHYMVWLEWLGIYAEAPPSANQGATRNVVRQLPTATGDGSVNQNGDRAG